MGQYRMNPGEVIEAYRLVVGPEGEIPDGIRPSTRNRGTYEYQPNPEHDHWVQVREGEWILFQDGKYSHMPSRDFSRLYQPVGDTPAWVGGPVRLPGFGPPEPGKTKPMNRHDKAIQKYQEDQSKAAKAAKAKRKVTKKPTKEEE